MRNASISGCGEPYQIESVPHTMRSGPDRAQQLAQHVRGFDRAPQHEVPGAPELGVHVRARARSPASARLATRRSTPAGGAIGIERAFLTVGIALVARSGTRGRSRRGTRPRRARCHAATPPPPTPTGSGRPGPCARRPPVRARRAHPLEEREPDLVVVEEPAAGGRRRRRRAVQRVALPPRRPERVVELGHAVELGGADVGVHDGVRLAPVPRPRSGRPARVSAAICGLSSTLWSASPGVDVEQRDRGLARREHVASPTPRRRGGAGRPRRASGRRRPCCRKPAERVGAVAVPARRVDEVRLHVDDGAGRREHLVGDRERRAPLSPGSGRSRRRRPRRARGGRWRSCGGRRSPARVTRSATSGRAARGAAVSSHGTGAYSSDERGRSSDGSGSRARLPHSFHDVIVSGGGRSAGLKSVPIV